MLRVREAVCELESTESPHVDPFRVQAVPMRDVYESVLEFERFEDPSASAHWGEGGGREDVRLRGVRDAVLSSLSTAAAYEDA